MLQQMTFIYILVIGKHAIYNVLLKPNMKSYQVLRLFQAEITLKIKL